MNFIRFGVKVKNHERMKNEIQGQKFLKETSEFAKRHIKKND